MQKNYSVLSRFPLGALTAEGFLKEQMRRNSEGMGGKMVELEPVMLGKPYVEREFDSVFTGGNRDGWAAEIAGNYWTGLIQMAFTMPDEALIARVSDWVDRVLKIQMPDGYLGVYCRPDSNIYQDFNGWGTACGMRGLLAFWEATGREDVFDAVYRCMKWFTRNWAGDKKTVYAGTFIMEPMLACYRQTGDEELLRFAEDYDRFLCENDPFLWSSRSFLTRRLQYNSNHTAGLGITCRMPALLYASTGRKELLRATEKLLSELKESAMHITGSPVSVCEYLAPVGSTTETEYCSYAFYNQTYSWLSAITGKAEYGDRMEQIFYNGAQGARKKDERAIAYLSAPNQFFATRHSSDVHDMQVYAPCYPVACCPVNAVTLLPEFVRGMMLHDEKGNIYLTAYGPCKLSWKGIRIEEKTLYPFRDTVEIAVDAEAEFSLFFRIPEWCRNYTVTVNGENVSVDLGGSGYAEIRRRWHPGDLVCIRFRMETEVLSIDDSAAAGKHPIAFRRGPLVYAMPISEKWKPYEGSPRTPLPDGWSWYEVVPDYQDPNVGDPNQQMARKRFRTEYNVAVDERIKPEDVTVEECGISGYPWENPPVKLCLPAYRAPYLCANYPEKTFEPFGDRQPVAEQREITLVPYGCTNLRLTYFPRAALPVNEPSETGE